MIASIVGVITYRWTDVSTSRRTILADTYPSIKSNLSRNLHASLSEALTIASLILDGKIEALRVACGQKNDLVRKLHQVRHTLAWLKASQVLF
jgi:hypothetical protein